MSPTFKKLNLKDHKRIAVLNAPPSFEPKIATLEGVTVDRTLKADVGFSLAFVTKLKEIEPLAKSLGSKAKGDAIVWLAYPKGTSKKYKSEFTRDTGNWAALGKEGFEPVHMVAIDEDWSALRFRRAEHIKTMTRDKEHRFSDQAKSR